VSIAESEALPDFTVDFEPVGRRVRVGAGSTLSDAAHQAGLPLPSECGGAGSCGKCRVLARQWIGNLNPITPAESARLSSGDIAEGYRLACQAGVQGDVKIDVPRASLVTGQRLQVESGTGSKPTSGTAADRVLRVFTVSMPSATLSDPRGDLDRVLDALISMYGLKNLTAGPQAVRALPALLRDHGWEVSALVRDGEIVGFMAPGARPLGLAVDLGTTKIAAYLVDLASGETLAAEGRPNPQIGYGEDVISRIGYTSRKPGGAQELARAVHGTLAEMAAELALQAGASPGEIAEFCIAGNTAMTHLLLELPVMQLATAPYIPAAAAPQETLARDLGLPSLGDARVYVPPCVAGFVGADNVAMVLSTNLDRCGRNFLGIDIGTNTEIVLARRGQARLAALSCASGPAFEGAHIHAGMRAASGAIERVVLEGGIVTVQTVGGAPPVGICGSGILDAVAELRRADILDARGRFRPGAPGVRSVENGGRKDLEFLLVPAGESGTNEEIVITQRDIVEIQMAKGAIQAGIAVLLEATGLQPGDLDEVVLAGAFGTHLNLESAIAVGLLPDLPLERFRQVGNAAGEGARQMLVSRAARARASEIPRQVDYIELAGYPGFKRHYARAMTLED
jgi:uncharacterized 2Fe-2S/4Fe-4S cluster protein (DUF4445 family)